MTIITITSLFYLDPENHSIDVYKASILDHYEQMTWENTLTIPDTTTENTSSIPSILSWSIFPPAQVIWLQEKIMISNIHFNVEYQELNWEKKYRYNQHEFTNKEEITDFLEKYFLKDTNQKIINHIQKK